MCIRDSNYPFDHICYHWGSLRFVILQVSLLPEQIGQQHDYIRNRHKNTQQDESTQHINPKMPIDDGTYRNLFNAGSYIEIHTHRGSYLTDTQIDAVSYTHLRFLQNGKLAPKGAGI